MTTTSTPAYQAAVTHTITLASLASDTALVAGREGTAIDQSGTDDAVDSVVGGFVTTGTGPTASRQIEVWLYGSYDGTTYSGGATGSNANLTPQEKTLLKLLTIIPTVNTSDKQYNWGPFSVAQAFGGTMPPKWGVYIVHNTGVNFNATGGNQQVKHTPVKYESV